MRRSKRVNLPPTDSKFVLNISSEPLWIITYAATIRYNKHNGTTYLVRYNEDFIMLLLL